MSQHTITIEPQWARVGVSVPVLFRAHCSCGRWHRGPNAPKWTLLAIQGHYVEAGLTNGRGLIRDVIASGIEVGDG